MTFNEPLSFSGVSHLVQGFIGAVSYVALPAILFAVVVIGFLYVSARGDAGTIKDTHGLFIKVGIAAVVLLGLWVIFSMGNAFIRFLIS
jgi:ABC-type nickel/cobalt efflux system permease component RcnA